MADDEWESLTNGRQVPNGTGLTSGPGVVNGLGYTRESGRYEDRGAPQGLHLFSAISSQVDGQELSRGLGVRRDLINGLSMRQTAGPRDLPQGFGPLARRRWARRQRLEELAEGPMPGEDR